VTSDDHRDRLARRGRAAQRAAQRRATDPGYAEPEMLCEMTRPALRGRLLAELARVDALLELADLFATAGDDPQLTAARVEATATRQRIQGLVADLDRSRPEPDHQEPATADADRPALDGSVTDG